MYDEMLDEMPRYVHEQHGHDVPHEHELPSATVGKPGGESKSLRPMEDMAGEEMEPEPTEEQFLEDNVI